jgi:hypothetical protein
LTCFGAIAGDDVRAGWWEEGAMDFACAGAALTGGAVGWAGAAARLATAGVAVPLSVARWAPTAGATAARATVALPDRTPPPPRNATRAVPE